VSQRVFLHVGLPKSGTSYVQRVLSENKQQLMDGASLLFPGDSWHDQVQAVRDVREMGPRRDAAGAWSQLVQEVHEWSGDAVISMEWLCAAEPDHIRRIFEDLAPSRVEVVFTARDIGRTLPAAWQEFIQNRYEWTWDEFLEGVSSEDPYAVSSGRAFWTQQDLATLVDKWAEHASAERTHVVTVPRPGAPHDVLWRRLARVFGIEPDGYVTEGLGGNESLGLESAELMRRLNPLTRDAGVRRAPYNQIYKHGLAKEHLAQRKGAESTLTLPARYHPWAGQAARRQVDALRTSGVQVVGDLTELELDPGGIAAERPESARIADADLLAPALAGLVALGQQWELSTQREAELEKELDKVQRRLARSQRRVTKLSRRVQTLSRRVTALSRRVQTFEAEPLRTAVRLRARSFRRT
jgi:hypothetical protein